MALVHSSESLAKMFYFYCTRSRRGGRKGAKFIAKKAAVLKYREVQALPYVQKHEGLFCHSHVEMLDVDDCMGCSVRAKISQVQGGNPHGSEK